MTPLLTATLPLRLPSSANLRLHWNARAKLVKAQRTAVGLALRDNGLRVPLVFLKLHGSRGGELNVRLTRITPRKLDTDNLATAFKAVRDQIAAELFVDDGSDAVSWLYAQEKGKVGIRIEVGVKT